MSGDGRDVLASLSTLRDRLRVLGQPTPWSPGEVAAIQRVDDVFGASLLWALYECRLVGPQRVDLAVLFTRGTSRERLRAALLDDPHRFPPAWSMAGRALIGWIFPGHPLSEAQQFSLEWDCAGALPDAPFPFVTIEEGAGVASSIDRARRLASALSEIVDDRVLSAAEEDLLRSGGPQTSVLHFGSMGPRGGGAHRWVIGMPATDVARFLRSIKWPGDAQLMQARAMAWAHGTSHVSLHLDLDDRVHPRLGVELFFPGPPRTDRRWAPVLDFAREHGLASDERLEAISTWPGETGGLTRVLDLKLVFDAEQPREAKGYLAFRSAKPGA